MNNHHESVEIGGSLEALVRQLSERWRQELAGLRAALDQQISAIETRFDDGDHKPAIEAAVKKISRLAADRAGRAEKEAEATAAKALATIEAELHARLGSEIAANALLRTALNGVTEQLESALKENRKLATELSQTQKLLLDVQARPKGAQAKANVEAQRRPPVTASQQLTDVLSQMRGERDKGTTELHTRKKPLLFSGPARDINRVKIRRGILVDVDSTPGELVNLSIGGAQALLTQAVKPNQLVRVTLPTADGPLTCKGRVVWVIYEQPPTSLSVYRTGVKFTEVDTTAVEKFMSDFAERPTLAQSRHSSGAA